MSAIAKQVQAKERPIVFSGPNVRAILSGQKTQGRCVVTDERVRAFAPGYADDRERINGLCPYGRVRDRLWVREALRWASDWLVYDADKTPVDSIPRNVRIGRDRLFATMMPRWACRITLEITAVRVERLREISCPDVWAEGSPVPLREHSNPELGLQCVSAKEWFVEEWDKLNTRRGYSWESNPWVWVISFQRIG